ncbi:MAG: SpoIIE family protein phosphatase [Elusimicrobiaceae bacterium]
MITDIVKLAFSLLQQMAVIIVLAYVLTRTRIFMDVFNRRFSAKNKLFLVLVFGCFSVYGTVIGIHFLGALVNIRNIGPVMGGLLGGPLIGLGAGLIGGVHRYFQGGITAVSSMEATILAGLLGGVVFLIKKGRPILVAEAVLLAITAELLNFGLAFLYVHPFSLMCTIFEAAFIPMAVTNSLGLALFVFIISNAIAERKNEAAKERLESELRIAREIQLSIVPRMFPAFPERDEFDIYAALRPAKEVGGDFYDFFFADDNHICVAIGDVSGKGVPAALFMAVTKTLIKSKTENGAGPDEILFRVNNELCDGNDSKMFVTVFLGIMDTRTGELVYSNGGHPQPYIRRSGGGAATLPLLPGRGLGVRRDSSYGLGKVKLEPGDQLFLYTDGVTEAMDARENMFSARRLDKLIGEMPPAPIQEQCDAVLNEIHRFASGADQSDDIAILMLNFSAHGATLSIEIKNELSELDRISKAIEDFAQRYRLPPQVVYDLELALEELIVNIISYGYDDNRLHTITVRLALKGGTLVTEIIDTAREFNPLTQASPDMTKPLHERAVGGMGIHLVRKVMDSVSYRRERGVNIITLTKTLKNQEKDKC